MKTINVNSPIKLIKSDTTPTSLELEEGKIAVGRIDGYAKIYANDGSEILDLIQIHEFISQSDFDDLESSGQVDVNKIYYIPL